MFKYLLLIWLLIYIYTLVQLFFEIREIGSLINILEKYLSSAQHDRLFAYFLNLYSDELKTLITAFF